MIFEAIEELYLLIRCANEQYCVCVCFILSTFYIYSNDNKLQENLINKKNKIRESDWLRYSLLIRLNCLIFEEI
jgi:hypothetical protein